MLWQHQRRQVGRHLELRPGGIAGLEGRDDLALLIRADDGDVSGGMAGKLRAGLAAARAGIDTLIVDGRVPGRLAQTLAGYEVPVTKLRANLDS